MKMLFKKCEWYVVILYRTCVVFSIRYIQTFPKQYTEQASDEQTLPLLFCYQPVISN